MDYMAMAAQLRATREAEDKARIAQGQQGGAATSNGGAVGMPGGGGNMMPTGGFQPQNIQQNPQQQNPLQTGLDAYNKYKSASNTFGGGVGAGSTLGATGTAYAGSGLGGTSYGLGGSLVSGGASGAGAGSGLGSALGTYGGSAAPSSFGALGSTTAGGAGGLLGGAGSSGGASLGGGSAAGAGSSGALGAAGGLAGLAALGYLGDKEMNQNKSSFINTDKINNAGTIGGSGIGLRFGDLVNGFNPATWLRNPGQAAKGLGNFFTLGFLDKI